jgi:c-di-AMP phosphodiesterase-like protein
MEKLGGGGHIDIAGAQLEDSTIEEARDLVKRTIKEMEENKEL